MGDAKPTTVTVWQALDAWAKGLEPWQRRILILATEHGRLTDDQIDEVYDLFLESAGLAHTKEREEVPFRISGRPEEELSAPLYLDGIGDLSGVNALPDGCSLTFGPELTVIYGRNGAGKSGFVRLCANACFSRNRPTIVSNIYAEQRPPGPSATFHFTIGGKAQEPFRFTPDTQHAELRRISVFDATAAQQRLSQSAPFEFKPAGFDIFPEMVRVYTAIAQRLDEAIRARTHVNDFPNSFIGAETEISKVVAALGPTSDLQHLRQLAIFGDTERARFQEVDKQLTTLKSKSPAELITQLQQAKTDIGTLNTKLRALGTAFTPTEAIRRTQLSAQARETAQAVALLGTDTFKRPFFKAVGTPEWQSFVQAAHDLGRKEGDTYPSIGDRCLLCERPFDETSRAHVAALLAFVEGDARRAAKAATEALQAEITTLEELEIDIFEDGSRVREHIRRLDPAVEASIADCVAALANARTDTIAALRRHAPVDASVNIESSVAKLTSLIDRIDQDIERLQADDRAEAIAALERERQVLRHREVLAKLLPSIEAYVTDAAWCAEAKRARSALNPKPVTDKEKELFSLLIREDYRSRLAEECKKLDCTLPIELQTIGQRGQTLRSLKMKGGYRPDMILSEGEQKAIALADFLTEVNLNPISAGIVLDDPVTSQDHERKERIAERLVQESKRRQVIVFTHDLPFLNMLLSTAEKQQVNVQAHWIERDSNGRPGMVNLNDAPATSMLYDSTERARRFLFAAKRLSGSARDTAIRNGMSALRRTIEETVAKRLLKKVVGRWEDRVMVTALKKINWDYDLVDELVAMYEELSRWIEAHSHTDEASGAPPEVKDLERKIEEVDQLIRRSRSEREKRVVPDKPLTREAAARSADGSHGVQGSSSLQLNS